MVEKDLLIIKRFIPVFIEKQNELSTSRINIAKPILLNIFSGLKEIESKRQTYIKENAPYFNIFTIMRYGHYETRLHTPFLVHLLTPTGDHQLGHKFFILFINHIFKDRLEPFNEFEIKNLQVFEEYTDSSLNGQIDIFVCFHYRNERFHVVIENKIYAGDGNDQLQRYYNFLESIKQKDENIRLIYLTKHGSNPSIPKSISQELFVELRKRRILKLLSYKINIANWVDTLININEAIPNSVYEILRQYLITIK